MYLITGFCSMTGRIARQEYLRRNMGLTGVFNRLPPAAQDVKSEIAAESLRGTRLHHKPAPDHYV